jgi:hypothetical protein
LRLVDFLVSKWLLKALYLRILPVPVTLKVFLARECVFTFGITFQFWDCKGSKGISKNQKNYEMFDFSCFFSDLPAFFNPLAL